VSSGEVDAERRQRLIKLGSATAFLALVVVAVLIVVSQSSSDGGDPSSIDGAAEVRNELNGIPQHGLVLGERSAKTTLVEFGDLQCPVCKGYAEEILPEVIESKVRSGEARLEFRNFIIINEESVDAAAAAIAAGEQGFGWDFIELFYRNQGTEASGYVTDEFMTALAEAVEVPNIERWNQARKSQRVIGRVTAETTQAERLGLTGTPSFAIEGSGVDGGRETLGTPGSAGSLEDAIEEAA
jgi:protein-disulfide isomerase